MNFICVRLVREENTTKSFDQSPSLPPPRSSFQAACRNLRKPVFSCRKKRDCARESEIADKKSNLTIKKKKKQKSRTTLYVKRKESAIRTQSVFVLEIVTRRLSNETRKRRGLSGALSVKWKRKRYPPWRTSCSYTLLRVSYYLNDNNKKAEMKSVYIIHKYNNYGWSNKIKMQRFREKRRTPGHRTFC